MHFDLRDAYQLDGPAMEKRKATFSTYIRHAKAVPLPWACFFLMPFMTHTTLKGAGRHSLSNF